MVAKIIVLIALLGISGFAGFQYSETKRAKQVLELNSVVYELGVVIQTQTNEKAEVNRKLKLANKGRIDAIKINDHNSKTVGKLQANLDRVVGELAEIRPGDIYRVVDINAIARVYDLSRRNCHGLPDPGDTPVISAQLSEFTGDSVARVFRRLVGQYCEVATDYNNLYLDFEKLIAQ